MMMTAFILFQKKNNRTFYTFEGYYNIVANFHPYSLCSGNFFTEETNSNLNVLDSVDQTRLNKMNFFVIWTTPLYYLSPN